jgi:5'-3' exonuclease
VGAVRALLWTLLKLLRKEGATHVAVAFDAMFGRSRPGPEAPPDALLRSQYLPATDAVRALGLTVWPMVRFQADDALATAARLYRDEQEVEQVILCSNDKDLLQCVNGARVVVLDRIHRRLIDEAHVRARFGVGPRSIPDYHALVGDPSDGLPGLPGFGPRAAAALLARYETIENIPLDPDRWEIRTLRGARALAEALRRQRREAILMRDLSTLRTDVPIGDGVANLEWRGADRPALIDLVGRIGADGIVERIARWRA